MVGNRRLPAELNVENSADNRTRGLLKGGQKGNKGGPGRPPNWFKEALAKALDRADAAQDFRIRAGNWSALRRELEATQYDGASALADWRAEVVSRLGQANIEVDWRNPPDDLQQKLSARVLVQTTRILREAVSNIIKHSGASQCSVRCTLADGDFQLVIQDNGKGIPMELDGKLDRGHGMSTMKGRAKQLQGQCLVESGPGYGTTIRLTLPL